MLNHPKEIDSLTPKHFFNLESSEVKRAYINNEKKRLESLEEDRLIPESRSNIQNFENTNKLENMTLIQRMLQAENLCQKYHDINKNYHDENHPPNRRFNEVNYEPTICDVMGQLRKFN